MNIVYGILEPVAKRKPYYAIDHHWLIRYSMLEDVKLFSVFVLLDLKLRSIK